MVNPGLAPKLIAVGAVFVICLAVLAGAATAGITGLLSGSGGGLVTGSGAGASAAAPASGVGSTPGIPADYLGLYQRAATACPGLSWTVLAAIGTIESDNGRSSAVGVHSGANSAGAAGPMQFEPATFAAYAQPVPAGGADPPSPYDPVDAIYAAAGYLCAAGARNHTDLVGAIYRYNHAGWYVTDVLTLAARYAHTQTSPGTAAAASTAAATALGFARSPLVCPTCGAATATAASTAPDSPKPPTPPPTYPCLAPPNSNTTPDPTYPPAPPSRRVILSSTERQPGTSPTSASPSTPTQTWPTPPTPEPSSESNPTGPTSSAPPARPPKATAPSPGVYQGSWTGPPS